MSGATGRLMLGALLAFGLTVAERPALAQADEPTVELKQFRIEKTDVPPVIDGHIDEDVWLAVEPIDDLHQVDPVEYASPSERTEIRVLYDSEALYVLARLWDSQPDGLTAQVLRQGEGLGSEDQFAIILDPYLDRRSGYRFELNANGVRWDALYTDTSTLESNWDGIWQGAASRDENGWTAEIAIPFKTLSFNSNRQSWGVNFSRSIRRNDESIGWVSRNRQLNPGVAGTMTGLVGIEQGVGLDIVTSSSYSRRRDFRAGTPATGDLEPSVDIFYKLTPSMNGALTLNTDFSATEVDDRQVNLTRFGLFFPEKRDFFLQDADIFEFGRIGGNRYAGRPSRGTSGQNARPFFSRRLGLSRSGEPVDIDYGAKLSGRVGRWNIGALAIRQDEYGEVDATDVIVGRLTASVLNESSVGIIVTDGDPLSNADNTLLGTDFRYRNTRLPGGRTLEAEAWYQETDTPDVVGENRAFGLGLSSPNNTGWRGSAEFTQVEENFNPAVGFVNERGIQSARTIGGYRYRFRDSYLRSVYASVEVARVERLEDGSLDRQITSYRIDADNSTGDSLFMDFARSREVIPFDFPLVTGPDGTPQLILPSRDYSWNEFFMGFRSGNHRRVSGFLGAGTGGYYDGEHTIIRSELEWRPSASLRLGMSYVTNDIDLPRGSFVVRQASLRAQYVFSSKLSWANLVQYDNLSESVGFNSRLHWIPEAGREGFVVLNHSLADPERNDSFHSTNSDISIKFSYTWRF